MNNGVEYIELPKLKQEIVINDISDTLVIDGRHPVHVFFVLLFLVLLLGIVIYFCCFRVPKSNSVFIKNIEILSYDVAQNKIEIAVVPSEEQKNCALVQESDDSLEMQPLENGKCYLTVPFQQQYVAFENAANVRSESLVLDNYVVDLTLDEKYYLPLGSSIDLEKNLVKVGQPEVTWIGDNGNLTLTGNLFVGESVENTHLVAMSNGQELVRTNIIVTDVIVRPPQKFDDKKKFLTCEVFSHEEAQLLDEILEYRIESAGYGTRAGAVAAARFLTLEFPYRISYYWENGRLNNTGTHYVDGEGRYYHKGLYLDRSKYDDIEVSLFGPAMWGCLMRSYEDDPPNFIPGNKYPNGLDCSGFVTWSLLNGGFDVGDRGAGDSPGPGQLTDLADFRKLTNSLIQSGEIKVGDLFNFWGHIAMIIGQDEENYYVAESLNNYKGLVVKTYSKKKVMNTFKYVVLMDDLYLEDGHLTDMWY